MSEHRCNARLVHRPEYEAYDFGAEHPLRPVRIRASLNLFASLGIEPTTDQQLQAPPASLEELGLVHTPRYVDAVQSLDAFADDPLLAPELSRWGLGPGDSPAFVGMHAAAALIAGGSLHAVRGSLMARSSTPSIRLAACTMPCVIAPPDSAFTTTRP